MHVTRMAALSGSDFPEFRWGRITDRLALQVNLCESRFIGVILFLCMYRTQCGAHFRRNFIG